MVYRKDFRMDARLPTVLRIFRIVPIKICRMDWPVDVGGEESGIWELANHLLSTRQCYCNRISFGICASPVSDVDPLLISILTSSSFVKTAPSNLKRPSQAAALSILLSPGLLIIDHIHFQYNGFMYGLLILSLVMARNEGTKLASGILFAILLCLKHIYLYLAPAYFVFLLSGYCLGPKFGPKRPFDIKFGNAIKLAVGIVAVFGAAFGPFLYFGQMPQIISRLFPFGRGLCHAYWAPNIWAMYSFTDRVLISSKSFFT